jgi:hypothetical protein
MRPFFIYGQSIRPSIPVSVRTGGPVAGLSSTRDFLFRRCKMTLVADLVQELYKTDGGRWVLKCLDSEVADRELQPNEARAWLLTTGTPANLRAAQEFFPN